MTDKTETIKAVFYDLGADLCGIASVDRFDDAPEGFHPCDLYPQCKSVVVFARKFPNGLFDVSPRIMYAKATEINLFETDRIAYLGALGIESLGFTAVPLPSDNPYEYWDEERREGRGILSMRHAAMLAGLGNMGKNTLVINEKYGNRIAFGAVLTDAVLPSDPLSKRLCPENCRKCIESCPVGALNGITVDQKKCREYTHGTNARGFSVTQCNTCRAVCPMGKGCM